VKLALRWRGSYGGGFSPPLVIFAPSLWMWRGVASPVRIFSRVRRAWEERRVVKFCVVCLLKINKFVRGRSWTLV
jgi:hypothetical protein